MQTVITVTINPALDKSLTIPRFDYDKKLRATTIVYHPGGGGINVARVIKRLGGAPFAVYTEGGPAGKRVTALLKEEGISGRPVPTKDLTRENILVMEADSERQMRFGMPGADTSRPEWQSVLDAAERSRDSAPFLVGSGSLPPGVPPDFYARLAVLGKRRGAKVIIDTSGEALEEALRAGVYMIKPNLRELRKLVGRNLDQEADQVDAAKGLIARKACAVLILSLGAAGVLKVTRDTVQRFRSPTVPIKSKVGAGDSLVGGLVTGLAQGKSVDEAILLGLASGAAAVMTPGTELCRPRDVHRLYRTLQRESAQSRS